MDHVRDVEHSVPRPLETRVKPSVHQGVSDIEGKHKGEVKEVENSVLANHFSQEKGVNKEFQTSILEIPDGHEECLPDFKSLHCPKVS